MEAEEPMVRRGIRGAVERRIPLHRLADVGDGTLDQRVQPPPDTLLPPRHRIEIRPHRRLAMAFRNLRVAAREEDRLGAVALLRGLLRLVGRSEEHTSELQSLMRISYAVFCL